MFPVEFIVRHNTQTQKRAKIRIHMNKLQCNKKRKWKKQEEW